MSIAFEPVPWGPIRPHIADRRFVTHSVMVMVDSAKRRQLRMDDLLSS